MLEILIKIMIKSAHAHQRRGFPTLHFHFIWTRSDVEINEGSEYAHEMSAATDESLASNLSLIAINDCSDSDTVTHNYIASHHHHCDAETTSTDGASQNSSSCSGNNSTSSSSTIFNDDILNDPDFVLPASVQNSDMVKKMDLSAVAIICEAKQVSLRSAACIISATLQAQKRHKKMKHLLRSRRHILKLQLFHTKHSV